jgi:hypothetical protein
VIVLISGIFQAKLRHSCRLIEKPFGYTTGPSCGGIAYIDPALRVNVADVLRQIAWYKSQAC